MAIKLYWCRGKGETDEQQRNFGDYLSPLIVEMLSSKAVVYAPIYSAEMMAIGSILPRERKAKRFFLPRRLHIWGAGTDAPDLKFSGRHHYHAVRGQKSFEQISDLSQSPVFGDPGLLANYWWEGKPKPEKRYRLGVIPHYVDQKNSFVEAATKLPGVLFINVFWPVEEVLRAIQSCDFILSSSMHGLIIADAFSVPNRRLRLSDGLISDFKFVDYYSAFGMAEPQPLVKDSLLSLAYSDPADLVGNYTRPNLADLQSGLIKAFPSL